MSAKSPQLLVRRLGLQPYDAVWQAMQGFTAERGAHTTDELWLLEHLPVFTLGRNAKPEHLLDPGEIPVQPVDRGGQVTYHGPGQLIAYLLLDLPRLGRGVRDLVSAMEQSIVDLLADHRIAAAARADAPGVYVGGAKIAALGLRVRRGFSYHGLSLNVAMDLAPFTRINPCGYAGMRVTQTCELGGPARVEQAAEALLPHLAHRLGPVETVEADAESPAPATA